MAQEDYGRKQFGSEITYCPNCGQNKTIENDPIYRNIIPEKTVAKSNQSNEVLTTLLLIFCFPIGLLVMWVLEPYTKKTRWIISLIFIVTSFLGFLMILLWTSMPGYLY